MSNTVKLKSIYPNLKVVQLRNVRVGQFVHFVEQNYIDKQSMSIGYNEFIASTNSYTRGVVVEHLQNESKTSMLVFYDNPNTDESAVIKVDSYRLVVPLSFDITLTPILK